MTETDRLLGKLMLCHERVITLRTVQLTYEGTPRGVSAGRRYVAAEQEFTDVLMKLRAHVAPR